MKRSMTKWLGMLLAIAVIAGLGAPALADAESPGLSLFGNLAQESNAILTPQGLLPSGDDLVALDDLGIAVAASDYVTIRQEDGFVYIYTVYDESMPYIIIGRYDGTFDDIASAYTDFMAGSYSDLAVAEQAGAVTLGGNTFIRIVYKYTVSGYTVQDTRMFFAWNGSTFMFGSKEVPGLNYMIGAGYLEQVAGSFAPLAGGWDDYAKHVDSTHSVDAAEDAPVNFGGLGTDVLTGDEPADSESVDQAPQTGPIGGVGDKIPADELAGSITFTEDVAKYQGTWVAFEDGFQLYLPSDWAVYSVSEEEFQSGLLYLAYDGNQPADPPYIEIDWAYDETCSTLDDLVQVVQSTSYNVDDKISVNGIPCVAFSSEAEDVSGLLFYQPLGAEHIVFSVNVSQFSVNLDTMAAMLCSLSPAA